MPLLLLLAALWLTALPSSQGLEAPSALPPTLQSLARRLEPAPRVRIFSEAYLRSLTTSPIKQLQHSVPFEADIPRRREPEEPLGRALKAFYDGAVYQRGYEQRLQGAELAPHLSALNAALEQQVPAELRANPRYRLGPYNPAEYERLMRLRQSATARGHQIAELNDDGRKQGFWGSNRQLLFGQVVTDVWVANLPAEQPPLHLLSAVFLSPSGGIIGPGTHNEWAEFVGKRVFRFPQRVLNYHAVCHDASGFCRTALDIGVGYTYTAGGRSPWWREVYGYLASCLHDRAKEPLAGQVDGCATWRRILQE